MTTITSLPALIGEAVFVGVFENQSEEWHAQRANGIGGSDIGVIAGLSKWDSAFSLWAKRKGLIATPPVDSEAAEWGTRLEASITDKFVEKHPDYVVYRSPGSYKHVTRDWHLANPDGLYYRDGELELLECKTAQYEDDWDEKSGEIPATYRAQVQWYMSLFGIKRATVAVLFHGNKYREFEVLADTFEQDTYIHMAAQFWACLQNDVAPEWDGAFATLEAVSRMHPQIAKGESVELGQLGIQYFLAVQEYDKAEYHMNELKSRVMDAMGSAERGLVEDVWYLSRQSRNGGRPYLTVKKGKK